MENAFYKIVLKLEEKYKTPVRSDEDMGWNRGVYECAKDVAEAGSWYDEGWIPIDKYGLPEQVATEDGLGVESDLYHITVRCDDGCYTVCDSQLVNGEWVGYEKDDVVAWRPYLVPYMG